jgi:hypothetical protein
MLQISFSSRQKGSLMKTKRLRQLLLLSLSLTISGCVFGADYKKILIPENSHPAVKSAARILAQKMALPESAIQTVDDSAVPGSQEIILTVSPVTGAQAQLLGSAVNNIKNDGYAIAFRDGGALICGVRPRSLLFAAGDFHQWRDETSGTFVRDPAFAIRTAQYHGSRPVLEYVSALGINLLIERSRAAVSFKQTLPEVYNQLSRQNQKRLDLQSRANAEGNSKLLQDCRDADVPYYSFLYGNDLRRWSEVLYEAVLKAYPSVKGKEAPSSWEKASLCPSEPMTWKIIDAYLREFVEQTQADGLYVTFWDNYGIYCQCDRCVKSGLNKFPNQLYKCVKQYRDTLSSMGKKLIVRTWSSGVPHWFSDQWVHAPGYDNFGGTGFELWSRVIKELPADITLQTKVYHADCQPDARFTTLLGKAQPHTEIAEYQIAGQTTGRFYFPASTVNHTAWTMKKSLTLVGPNGGVSLFPGGTRQTNYSLLDDILNSINVYAWRELSWDVNADLDKVWMDWAVPIYGEKAAPHIVKALKLSEDAVNYTFSTLGMGSSTNSDFAKTIRRRETLLMYTNRHFLPEYAKNLEPTKENIQRVVKEKKECLKKIDEMFRELELARPYLRKEQADELATRFDWLKEFAIVKRYLEESLWRYRYLRHLASILTTDPEQMKYLAQAYDAVREHQERLFRYQPEQKFSCYNTTLGKLRTKPGLGNPLPLMKELYEQSKEYVEEFVGPDYLPAEWNR